jgi:hypothetical protein
MGVPVKLEIQGQPVFLCCVGCIEKALENPAATLAKVTQLKTGAPGHEETHEGEVDSTTTSDEEADIAEALAKLPEGERDIADAQRFCPVLSESRLGSMGTPVKLLIEGEPVFLCCEGCKAEALKDPKGTLARVADLKRARVDSSPK